MNPVDENDEGVLDTAQQMLAREMVFLSFMGPIGIARLMAKNMIDHFSKRVAVVISPKS